MADEVAGQGCRHSKLNVGIDVGIAWIEDLGNQRLVSLLEDQGVKMRWSVRVTSLRF